MKVTGVKLCPKQKKIRIAIGLDNNELIIILGNNKQLNINADNLLIRFSEENIIMSTVNSFTLSSDILSGMMSKYTQSILEQKLILMYELKVKKWNADDMTLDALLKNLINKLSEKLNSHLGKDSELKTNRQYLISILKETTIMFQ